VVNKPEQECHGWHVVALELIEACDACDAGAHESLRLGQHGDQRETIESV
jgi:hypothetical protein